MTILYSDSELAEAMGESVNLVRTMRRKFHHPKFHHPEGMDLTSLVVVVRNIQRDMDREMAGSLDQENQILLSRLRMALQKVASLEADLATAKTVNLGI